MADAINRKSPGLVALSTGFVLFWLVIAAFPFLWTLWGSFKVQADFFSKAFNALRPGGRYGTCGATTGLRSELHLGLLFSQQKEIYGVFMGNKEDMREIVTVLNRGLIRPVVDRVFPLQDAAEAHRAMEETNFFGKLILAP